MRLDWQNDWVGRICFDAGKLAKSQSNHNITRTKPVNDSVQIVPLGIIERNPKQLGQYSEALVALHGGKLCCDLFGKIR
jgi:hypothetical protein